MNQAFGRTAALKAVFWTTGSTYIGYILGLLINVLIARRLDAGDFGRYAYLVWLSGVLVLIANNGLTTTGIKYVSETLGKGLPDEAADIYGWLRRLQPVFIGVVAIAYLVAMPFILPAGWEGRLTAFAGAVLVSFIFKAWAMLNSSIAKGYGQFTAEPITSTTALTFNAIVAGVLALLNAPVEAYAMLFAATSVTYALVSQFLLRRVGIVPTHARLKDTTLARIRRHLFWTATLAAITTIGSRSIETFLLNNWVGAAEVGFFAIATNLTRAGIDLLVAGLSSVMMPILGYMIGTGDHERAQRVFGDAARYYQFMGLLIAGVGLFWAHAIVGLMYGERYLAVVPVFRIMVMTSGMLLANGAFAAILANSDNQPFRVGVAVLSFAISLSVAIILIPRYGLIGAAAGQAISAVLYTIVVVIGIHRFSGFDLPWWPLAKQYAIALGSGLVALAVAMGVTGILGEWLSGLVYVALLVVVSLRTGVWRADERDHLARVLSAYPQLRFLSRFLSTTS